MAKNLNPQIDAYIETSADFARPILRHLRDLVHRACPGVEEAIKWRMPFFTRGGKMLCSMAAFKAHCVFGFWHREMEKLIASERGGTASAGGLLGRITSLADVPDDKTMIRYIRTAAELDESNVPSRPRLTKPKPEAKVPADLSVALKKNKKAATTFANFSPSQRREYIEWIVEAKRQETRQKRLATTLGWLSEGKSRNWKYENC
jgi:uncharacterized protein YdeI (YjbR/CyaY-like superfamily)